MTYEQYQQYLANMVNDESNRIITEAILPAANRLNGNIQNRIMRDGKASDGSKLSPYSTNPAYFSQKQFIRKSSFVGGGKKGKKIGAKTMYLSSGYKQLRDVQGMPTNVKTLQYSGDMFRALVVGRSDSSVLIGFNEQGASDKRKWNEEREGKDIFKATRAEMKEYAEEFKKEYVRIKTENLR